MPNLFATSEKHKTTWNWVYCIKTYLHPLRKSLRKKIDLQLLKEEYWVQFWKRCKNLSLNLLQHLPICRLFVLLTSCKIDIEQIDTRICCSCLQEFPEWSPQSLATPKCSRLFCVFSQVADRYQIGHPRGTITDWFCKDWIAHVELYVLCDWRTCIRHGLQMHCC